MDNLSLLDECVDSDYDKLVSLISGSFDHFTKFYSICKEIIGADNIDGVTYTDMGENTAKFDISCKNNSDFTIQKDETIVDVTKTDNGVSLHIFLKKEGEL